MFRFEHIEYLFLLLLIPVLAIVFNWFKNKQAKEWEAFAKNKQFKKFTYGMREEFRWNWFIIFALCLILAIVGLANPQYSTKSGEAEIETSDIFIAMDISHSMLANDLRPNRLTRAKNLAQKIIESLEGNRIGLILFAGEAYMFMPLTDDVSSAISFVQSANTNMAPTQGTAIAAAIDLAMNSFDPESETGKAIVLLSDGEDHEKSIDEAVAKAADEDVYVFTIAIGTDAGAYLPGIGRDNYLFDEMGKPVKSVVNTKMLEDIAKETKASFFNISKEKNIDIAIANNVGQMEKQVEEVARFKTYDSYYQYLLLPLILWALWQLLKPVLSYYLTSKTLKEVTE